MQAETKITSAMEEKLTGVYVTDEQAEMFKLFLKHYNVWRNVFSQDNRNTEIHLHFNKEGEPKIGKRIQTFGI